MKTNRLKLGKLCDRLITEVDGALRSLGGGVSARRPSPAAETPAPVLEETERRHAAGLMRVNHSGEICAQALYRGQAFTARNTAVRRQLCEACLEEADHLAWCEERLRELKSRPSLLNPAWYGLSWGLGALSGLAGDRWNLGFLAATEEQVGEHLREHLERLPEADTASRSILQKMLEEETRHVDTALQSGGRKFPAPVQGLMRCASRLMTASSYRL